MNVSGFWVGDTIGLDTPEHHWILLQVGGLLQASTKWEGEDRFLPWGLASIIDDSSFFLETANGMKHATLIDSETFILQKWVGEEYDVRFRRQSPEAFGQALIEIALDLGLEAQKPDVEKIAELMRVL